MALPLAKMSVGVAIVSLTVAGAVAAPPSTRLVPLPFRNFPSEKELGEFLEPPPPLPIPDPPPHEGAMIDTPYVVEPPDLLLVEVLEALPGRPISGERLVRPDGKVSLGFYGEIYVRGLTPEQIKAKILLHLRSYLPDEVLGLYRSVDDGCGMALPAEELPELPEAPQPLPPRDAAPGDRGEGPAARPQARRTASSPGVRRVASGPFPKRGRPQPLTAPKGEKEQNRWNAAGTNDQAGVPPGASRPLDPTPAGFARVMAIHPADSDRIFVDVTAYNSQTYQVIGDVATPGRMPCTGKETILDALTYAGGLIATADPKDIRLVRPSYAGKPARVYPVDLDAIVKEGNAKANLQVFPGDRVVVGRNPIERATIEIDRQARQFQSVQSSMLMSSLVMRALAQGTTSDPASPGSPISVRIKLGDLTWTFDAGRKAPELAPAQREALLKEWADFWWKIGAKGGGGALDEATFREALMRQLNPEAAPAKQGEAAPAKEGEK